MKNNQNTMKMKKFLSMFAFALMSVMVFTACDDDDNNEPTPQPVDVSEGVFIVNSGNAYSQIDGSLTYINTTTSTASQSVFQSANGRSLGGTVNDAVVYGSKLYIVATDENTVEVVDRTTLKSIRQLSTTSLMGAEKGLQPRHLLAYDGKVYVSAYGASTSTATDGSAVGYVAAIDTTTYAATTYAVGSYPEGMAANDGIVYVANSSYGNGVNPSISAINTATGTVTQIKDALITNPVGLSYVAGALYILDSGLYDASWNQSGQGVRKYENGTVTKIADATLMATYYKKVNDGVAAQAYIYMVNAPYTYPSTPVTYSVYDITAGTTSTFIDGSDIFSPGAIGVDPVTGKVYITSYVKSEYGSADYNANGYVVEYSAAGTKTARYDTGVGPSAVAFNTAVVYE